MVPSPRDNKADKVDPTYKIIVNIWLRPPRQTRAPGNLRTDCSKKRQAGLHSSRATRFGRDTSAREIFNGEIAHSHFQNSSTGSPWDELATRVVRYLEPKRGGLRFR
jgi:hypothetical protein